MRASRRAVGAALLGCFVAVAPLPGQQTPAGLLRFLRQSIGLDSAQLAQGTGVARDAAQTAAQGLGTVAAEAQANDVWGREIAKMAGEMRGPKIGRAHV